MNRRDLLKTLIASGIGATLDPERLIWTPGQMIAVPRMPQTWYVIPNMVGFGHAVKRVSGATWVGSLREAVSLAEPLDTVVWPINKVESDVMLNYHSIVELRAIVRESSPRNWVGERFLEYNTPEEASLAAKFANRHLEWRGDRP